MNVRKTSYYAIINDRSSRKDPAGILRRVETNDGERDEVFTRDLVWKRSSSLYSAERGDQQNEFVEISADEAEQIVERIKKAEGSP